ncbi:MAG: hypothetical protein R2752_03650 [Vicinamibacterales bacterium]
MTRQARVAASAAAAFALALLVPVVTGGGPVAARQEPAASTVTPEALAAAIDRLGDFDFRTRTDAARLVRRAPAAMAAPALARAVREHDDEYVRYRALVLVAGLGSDPAAGLMRQALEDRNDRLRTVAGGWYEHHPDPDVLPVLIRVLEGERSEFVRPALTRAVAAQSADPRAQAALAPLVLQGQDFFRGGVIEALGDYGGTFALDAIDEVARQDGPLQDDAITAIAKLGAKDRLTLVAGLQKTASPELQPTVSAALCLLGLDCEPRKQFILQSLQFAAERGDDQPLLRGAVHALALLAVRGHDEALTALIDRAAGAPEEVRAPIALAVGQVAIRHPEVFLRVLEARRDPSPGIGLLRDAFDMLSEDFEEERFYVTVRRAYWAAAEGSATRRVAEALIVQLEF